MTYSLKSVKLNCKLAVLGIAAVLALCTGCGGIQASHSVSPATFLLPGFGQVTPESGVTPCETNQVFNAPQLATLH